MNKLSDQYLIELLQNYRIHTPKGLAQKLQTFYDLLITWNRKVNLTRLTGFEEFLYGHFLDSVMPFSYLPGTKGHRVLDVGTGPGFPGIPMKLVVPDLDLVLIDSEQKKIHFLEIVVSKMALEGVEVLHARGEQLGRLCPYREGFDYVVSRAVSSLNMMCELCLPFVKTHGYMIAWKTSKQLEEELDGADKAIQHLGGRIERVQGYALPDDKGDRKLVMIKKCEETPSQYPRTMKAMRNRPL